MNQRLKHDAVMAMATACLDLIKPCLRDEEWRDAFEGFSAICTAGIEAYEIQKQRMLERLNPTKN
jgi:hypothetical protein